VLVLAVQRGGPRKGPLQRGRMLVEPARIGRVEQRLVESRNLGDAANGALEMEAVAFPELSLPAALGLLGERVEPPRHVSRRLFRFLRVAKDGGPEDPRDRGLLDYLAIVTAVQPVQHVTDDARLLHKRVQIRSGAMLA